MYAIKDQCLELISEKHGAAMALLVGVIQNIDHLPAEKRDAILSRIDWAMFDIAQVIAEIRTL